MQLLSIFKKTASVAFIGFLAACSKTDDVVSVSQSADANQYSAAVPQQWFQIQLSLVKQTSPSLGFSPPVASRAFGYTGVALYETIVNGLPNYKSIASQLNISVVLPKPNEGVRYNWNAAANACMAQMTKYLFEKATAQNIADMEALEADLRSKIQRENNGADMAASENFGRSIALAIYSWSLNDGGADGATNPFSFGYATPTGPGMWEPTFPAFARPLLPRWGLNRPFQSADTTGVCMPPPPIAFGTAAGSDFHTQAMAVVNAKANLTTEQITIAQYWADGGGSVTPPGHSMAITSQLIAEKRLSLGRAAEVYAKIGMAVADAFVACWRGKYIYNIMRPITYINTYIDPNWRSLITTPNFPEYCSGHSTQSGAAAEVLTTEFGAMPFTDQTKTWDGNFTARSYANFHEAAQEAAISRLYGGIHYPMANDNGYNAGVNIGKSIEKIVFKK
jgi:hypothetical protein